MADNNQNSAGFSPQQCDYLAAMIEQAVAGAIARERSIGPIGPLGPPGPPGPAGPSGAMATPDTSWKVAEIGCFDLDNRAATVTVGS